MRNLLKILMYKYFNLVVQRITEIGNCYFIWINRRTAGYKKQHLEVSNDQLILSDDKSHSRQRHVDNVTIEEHDTSENQNNTVFSESKTDKSRKQISFAKRQRKKTGNAINKTIVCQSPKVKCNKSQFPMEIRNKCEGKVSKDELLQKLPLIGLHSMRAKKTYNADDDMSGSGQRYVEHSTNEQNDNLDIHNNTVFSGPDTDENKKKHMTCGYRQKKTDISIKKNLSSNVCTNCPSQQVKNMKHSSPKLSRLQNSHSCTLFSKIPFSQCYILIGLCCEVSGNSNPKMYLSVNHTKAIFNESFSLLCHIKNATECTNLSFLHGSYENNDMQWKVLARGDIPYTQPFVPSSTHSEKGITYNLTIPQLQPDDVGAWFRCECDERNNVSKRLIEITDRLTVNPELFKTTFKILNMVINFTTDIWNVYPHPENCTLTILQSGKHSQLLSYNRTHCTTRTKPDLFNATYSGFFNTQFKLCKPNITVICYFGDSFISESYTPDVCDELENLSEVMMSYKKIFIVTGLCVIIVIALAAVRWIWTKRRKDGYTNQ